MKIFLSIVTFLLLCTATVFGQEKTLTGVVNDAETGAPVPGANVLVKGTTSGTSTNNQGEFKLSVPSQGAKLVVSFIGYNTQELDVPESNSIVVNLAPSSSELEEVVVSVGRGSQRTLTDTPLPVDNFTSADLKTSGQISFDKALQYRVPSFNTVNTPINDATSLFDPYEIRNLGPSRTLILINGKRKNLTSLVYTQTSPGRGETGADLSAIPVDAIKRVEILRDGASAQYGSDAIAGVVNIILKDKHDATTISLNTGSTLNYGGLSYGLNYNSGANIGSKGFINYHISLSHQDAAFRKDKLDADGDAATLTDNSLSSQQQVKKYLEQFPDGNNKNGTPDNTSAKFLLNGAIPVGEKSEIYANAAYIYRKAISWANFRQPYWRVDHGLLHTPDASQPDYTVATSSYAASSTALYNSIDADKNNGIYKGYIGYQPTMEGDLNDYNGTLGFRTTNANGWNQDLSVTVGGNKMLFTVANTINRSLRKASPVYFKPGGFNFNHVVGNMDFSKSLRDNLHLSFGSEFRNENWELIAGDTASHSGEGSNSFFGYLQSNAIKASRYNLGAYADLTWDITDRFLIGGTYRVEKYSDFGNTNVFKVTSRYKFGEILTVRGAFSTGFRAPTLHQQYLSLSQYSFQGGTIQVQGLANNLSAVARSYGIPSLKAEKSENISFGIGLTPSGNFSLTADYYYITIKDRIVYSNEVTDNSTSFFINAAETRTSGVDVVVNYRGLDIGSGKLALNLAGNYTIQNELVGGYNGVNKAVSLNLPPLVKKNTDGSFANTNDLFNLTQESLMVSSRPKYKFILGADYTIKRLGFNLYNTLFGPTKFNNGDMSTDLDLQFVPKVVTDLNISYSISEKAGISITVQNLLNVFPKYEFIARNSAGSALLADEKKVKEQVNAVTFNGRYPVLSYDGSHFNQMGTSFLAQFTYKF